MRIAVTGASGFIGRHLVPYIAGRGHQTASLSRSDLAAPDAKLSGADALIHLAAIAHSHGHARAQYERVNRDLPLALSEAARRSGVRRFVFVSSINAETRPDTPYGATKAEAERALLAMAGIEIVVIRPAAVYGDGTRGNFALLSRLARSPLPLPFAGTRHRRSLIAVDNLVDALVFAAVHPGLAGLTLTATDPGPPLKLSEIVSEMRAGLHRPPGLFPGPADLAFPEMVADGSSLFAAGWTAPYSAQAALRRLASR